MIALAIAACLLFLCVDTEVNVSPRSFSFFAYYFPQYYPAKENKYFNDWKYFTNNEDTVLQRSDRTQIMSPIKKYDPRDTAARRAVRERALEIRLDGLIYYHYFLEDHPVLSSPLEAMLLDGEPDMPFFFLWVNEDFQYAKQTYGSAKSHAIYLCLYFSHKNYVHVEGRPLLYVYDFKSVPNEYLKEMRLVIKEMLNKDVLIYQMVQGYRNNLQLHPAADGYAEFAVNLPEKTRDSHVFFAKPVQRGTFLEFDNYIRKMGRVMQTKPGKVIKVRDPDVFEHTCIRKIKETGKDEKIISVFAFNEWAEQAVLEENNLGLDYAGALRNCISAVKSMERESVRQIRSDSKEIFPMH